MNLKVVICHLSCMLLALALYGISGVSRSFELNLSMGPIMLLVLGLIGISYSCVISHEKAVFTAVKLIAVSLQWFLFMFGTLLAILSFSNSPWYMYLSGALVSGFLFVVLFRVQKISS